ncbi:MAG: HEAT repeat domain-containing protein [Gemmataceae bacterium]
MLPKILVGTIIASFLGLVVLGTWSKLTQEDAETLTNEALSGPDASVRLQAALRLSLYGADGVAGMRRVLAESEEPDVRAAMLDGLAAQRDWESMPTMIAALDDENAEVRRRAASAINHLFNRDFGLRPDTPAAERAKTIELIRDMHKTIVATPPDFEPES